VSGHSAHAYAPVLSGLQPHSATVVVLMGLASRSELASFLLARGWRAETPAAVVWAASTAASRRWLGRLDSLADSAADEGADAAPGTVVIGDVVAFAEQIRPSERWAPAAAGGA
jgi:siroheme synthase